MAYLIEMGEYEYEMNRYQIQEYESVTYHRLSSKRPERGTSREHGGMRQ